MSDYITKFTMKHDYNMTDALIKKLGEPDKTASNPHYRSAAPMQLYLRERVEKWCAENPDLIQKVIERREKRPLKPPPPPPEPVELPKIRFVKPYRKSVRQVGDKWSWTVYHVESNRMLQCGWADDKSQADSACQQVINTDKEAFRAEYWEW